MFGAKTSTQQLAARAVELQRAGRFLEAIPLLQQALRGDPDNHELLGALGTCQTCINQVPEARENLQRAVRKAPREAKHHYALAFTHKREADFVRAHECIDRALSIAPKHPMYTAAKAELFHMAGEHEKAMRTLEPVLWHATAPLNPSANVAGIFALVARHVQREPEAIAMLEKTLARTDLPPAGRIKYSFDLAALYDAIGDHDRAFEAYRRGNALKGDRWDAARHSALTDAVIATWTRAALATLPRANVDGSRFVFIVGMPRSGTSLIEQIISTAPGVFAAGELNDLLKVARDVDGGTNTGLPMVTTLARLATPEDVDRAGRAYVEALAKLAGPEFTRVTDKLPVNFLHLGLIQTVLPGAKVIHCRREAMDSCLSCYFQLFAGFLPFAGDLTDCGRFYVDYERLMAHWHATLDLPILDVPYEDLVADQEGMTRTILGFLGLPFSDSALRFYDSKRTTLTASSQQVREPIYRRSIARWKKYAKHLGGLRVALGSFAPKD